MVTVQTFGTRADAELAQSFLRGESIDAVVAADDAGGNYPSLSAARLLVSEHDYERARQLLASPA